MKPCTNALYVSLISRCDSAAIVPNTSDDLPDPETPVNTVSRRLGISTLMSFRLFSRAPWTRIRSWLSAACWLEEAVFTLSALFDWLSFMSRAAPWCHCLHAPLEQGLLRVRRCRCQRALCVRESAVAIPAPAVKLSQRRIPQVISKQPPRHLDGLERGEPGVGPLPLGNRDRTIEDVER